MSNIKKIRRCLLFVPSAYNLNNDIFPAIPLGLGYIASVLRNLGKEVKIVDCLIEGYHSPLRNECNEKILGIPSNEISSIISEFNPDIVTVNNQFTKNRDLAHEIYALSKEINPEIITIAGGAHPSVLPELVLEDRNVDYVVIGEGEHTLVSLLSFIESGTPDIDTIEGLGYHDEDVPVINRKNTFIEDLDSIPFPSWDLMHIERYFGLEQCHGKRIFQRFCSIITSRGCPANCIFCTARCVWGKRYRGRSPENVVKEIIELKKGYDIEEILVEDDNFTFDVARAEKICDLLIKENFHIRFDTPNGIAAYRVTPHLLNKMKQAGFRRINFAIESGNQRVLTEVIKKPLQLDHLVSLIHYCRTIDLEYGLFFIIGLPGTTLSEMFDNYRFLRKIKHVALERVHISVATPYPGSALHSLCEREGYLNTQFSLKTLYIRSFLITTKEWKPAHIKLLMLFGSLYVHVFSIPLYFKRDPLFLIDLFKERKSILVRVKRYILFKIYG